MLILKFLCQPHKHMLSFKSKDIKITVHSENHTEHINTLCEQNLEFLNAKTCITTVL
jgi:hypothetical protein